MIDFTILKLCTSKKYSTKKWSNERNRNFLTNERTNKQFECSLIRWVVCSWTCLPLFCEIPYMNERDRIIYPFWMDWCGSLWLCTLVQLIRSRCVGQGSFEKLLKIQNHIFPSFLFNSCEITENSKELWSIHFQCLVHSV